MATNNAVNSNLSGTTGSGNFVGSTSPAITTPSITTSLKDTNGNTWIGQTATGSAVNYVNVTDNSTTNPPIIAASGSDTNITLQLNGKGTGGAAILGSSTNDSASSGYVGEYISQFTASGSAVSLTSGSAANIAQITISAGDWDVWGSIYTLAASGTVTTSVFGQITTNSATFTFPPTQALPTSGFNNYSSSATQGFYLSVGQTRYSVSTNTTIYLVCTSGFSVSTLSAFGNIAARRAR